MLWPSRRNYQAWCFRAVPLEGKGEVVLAAKVLGHSSQCFFLWCGSTQKAIPSHPMKDAAQRQTEQQDVPQRG